jgi:hypothetical protein
MTAAVMPVHFGYSPGKKDDHGQKPNSDLLSKGGPRLSAQLSTYRDAPIVFSPER